MRKRQIKKLETKKLERLASIRGTWRDKHGKLCHSTEPNPCSGVDDEFVVYSYFILGTPIGMELNRLGIRRAWVGSAYLMIRTGRTPGQAVLRLMRAARNPRKWRQAMELDARRSARAHAEQRLVVVVRGVVAAKTFPLLQEQEHGNGKPDPS